MNGDTHARDELRRRLADAIGEGAAETLMESLPPNRWDELAHKRDLEALPTKRDIEALPTKRDLEQFATKRDLEQFATKRDLEQFATKRDLDALATHTDRVEERLTLRMETLEHRLTATFRGELVTQTRTLFFGQLGAVVATAAAVLAAVKLA